MLPPVRHYPGTGRPSAFSQPWRSRPSPPTARMAKRRSHSAIRKRPFVYCNDTVLPISANFLYNNQLIKTYFMQIFITDLQVEENLIFLKYLLIVEFYPLKNHLKYHNVFLTYKYWNQFV